MRQTIWPESHSQPKVLHTTHFGSNLYTKDETKMKNKKEIKFHVHFISAIQFRCIKNDDN